MFKEMRILHLTGRLTAAHSLPVTRKSCLRHRRQMVTLVVAITTDPASIGPADGILARFSSIMREDHLDKRWEAATGEVVDEVIFLSKHIAASNRPPLTVHPIGVSHLREGEVSPGSGKPGWATTPNARIGLWFRLLKTIFESHKLTPEFEVTLEATHHGPEINSPTMFVEIGSTEEYWKRQDAAQASALLVWEGLGLGGGVPVGDWTRNNGKNKILLGIGGGHYVPRHMDIVLKNDAWVGHLLSGYSLPMEVPDQPVAQANAEGVGRTWREANQQSRLHLRLLKQLSQGEKFSHILITRASKVGRKRL